MKENLLKFGIKVILISVVLYMVWSLGGRDFYMFLMRPASVFLLKIFIPKLHTFGTGHYGFSMLIPFLSLSLATKTPSLKIKLYKTLIGVGVIIAWNFILVFIWYFLFEKLGDINTFTIQQRSTLFFLSGILPFLLWAILFKENLKELFYPKKRKPSRAAV
jgi:hypothetical protein